MKKFYTSILFLFLLSISVVGFCACKKDSGTHNEITTDKEISQENSDKDTSKSPEPHPNNSSVSETPNTTNTPPAEGTKDSTAASGTSSSSGNNVAVSNTSASQPDRPQGYIPSGGLQVIGSQLCDSSGNPIQLKGISTHGLSWYPDYVNKQCISELHNTWNANVFRLAMYTADYNGYCNGGNQANLKNLVCQGIDYAAQEGMYVIVDWHILSDGNPNTYIEQSKSFFHEISAKYANSNHILYEICNEPNGGTSWSQIKSYAEAIIPVIRANDPDAIIIVGTPNWSQFVDQAAANPISGYDNIMYALHFYAATHKGDLRSKMTSAIASGLPIFVTEFGICDASGNGALDIDSANTWVSEMNRLGVSYVAWNLSNKNESSAILNSSCNKVNGFSQADLSNSGKWVYQTLTNKTALPSVPSNSSGNNNSANANSNNNNNNAHHDAGPTNNTPSGSTATNGNLTLSLSLINNWESNGMPFYQYSLSITNSGSACTQWAVDLSCNGTVALSDSWNGNYSLQGNKLHITSKEYNGSLTTGQTASDIGFIVSGGTVQIQQ